MTGEGMCQDFCELVVYVSEVENCQCEVPGLSNVNKIVSGLSEPSCFVNLRCLAFGRSEKDDPCNELSF